MTYAIDPAYERDETTSRLPAEVVDSIITNYTLHNKLHEIETFDDYAKYQIYKELNKRAG